MKTPTPPFLWTLISWALPQRSRPALTMNCISRFFQAGLWRLRVLPRNVRCIPGIPCARSTPSKWTLRFRNMRPALNGWKGTMKACSPGSKPCALHRAARSLPLGRKPGFRCGRGAAWWLCLRLLGCTAAGMMDLAAQRITARFLFYAGYMKKTGCHFRIAALKWSFATPANSVHLKRRCGNFGWTEG